MTHLTIAGNNCIPHLLFIFQCRITSGLSYSPKLAKFKYISEMFKLDFFRNESVNEKKIILFDSDLYRYLVYKHHFMYIQCTFIHF